MGSEQLLKKTTIPKKQPPNAQYSATHIKNKMWEPKDATQTRKPKHPENPNSTGASKNRQQKQDMRKAKNAIENKNAKYPGMQYTQKPDKRDQTR